MAAGMVVRDHLGHCLIGASELFLSFTSPELAEALALRRVVSLAHDHGFNNITFASDCLSLIQRVSSEKEDKSPVSNLVADIRFRATVFQSILSVHVHRLINNVAHVLARSCNGSSSSFILDYAPDLILYALCIDRE
jgi:hypothetical protein